MTRVFKKQVRVVAGTLKGRLLTYPAGAGLRPTMQRTKAAVFDSLGESIRDSVFVDLYAAAGGMGIEALSRGVRFAHFVETDRRALECLETNLDRCGIGPDHCAVHPVEVMNFLHNNDLFDREAAIVYADPPYESEETRLFLEFFASIRYAYFPLLILEHRSDAVPRGNDPRGLERIKLKRFGQSWVSFFAPARGERS